MKTVGWLCMSALLVLAACTAEGTGDDDRPFIGKPIDISLSVEGSARTRAVTALTTGTAWLNGGSSHMKPYIYASGAYTSTDPLVWTGMNMTISGYYAGTAGQTTVTSDLAYSIDYSGGSTDGSFLAGQASASYAEQTRVAITLRQQLALVYVSVRAESGSTIANAKLHGIYAAGTFRGDYDGNGYATGGSNGSGWAVSGSTATISMSAATGTNAYQAVIIPQTVSSGATFFSVEVDGLQASFQLASTMTFKAGCQYNLSLDQVSQTLYLESEIQIADFGTGDSASESNVQAE